MPDTRLLSSYLAAKTPYFMKYLHLPDLQQRRSNLIEWCTMTITRFNILDANGNADIARQAGELRLAESPCSEAHFPAVLGSGCMHS